MKYELKSWEDVQILCSILLKCVGGVKITKDYRTDGMYYIVEELK